MPLVRPRTVEAFLAEHLPAKDPLVTGLLHRRDLVTLAARRRHGKTTCLMQLAADLAVPASDFLGFPIPRACRSLLVLLEDDPGELQDRFRLLTEGRSLGGRIHHLCREDFHAAKIPIDVGSPQFQKVLTDAAHSTSPDLVVLDNLAHLVAAEYSDPKRIHHLMDFVYTMASNHNCAVIIAAHPRKDSADHRSDLLHAPGDFFESVMGSSHLINSTGSLWGLERREEHTIFLGGRQRGDGCERHLYLAHGANKRFTLIDDFEVNIKLACNTPARKRAWDLLPARFAYNDGMRIVQPALRSSSSFDAWIRHCLHVEVLEKASDGSYFKRGLIALAEAA